MLQIMNATSNMGTSWSNNVGLFGLIAFAAAMILGATVLSAVLSSFDRYKQFWRLVERTVGWTADVAVSALVGAVTIGIVFAAYLAWDLLAGAAVSVDPRAYAYIFAGFAASTIVGFLVRKALGRIGEYARMMRDEKKPEPKQEEPHAS